MLAISTKAKKQKTRFRLLSTSLANEFVKEPETFEKLTDDAISHFSNESFDEIRGQILEMESYDRSLFSSQGAENLTSILVSNLIQSRLKQEPPINAKLKIFYAGFYWIYLSEWLKHFTLGKNRDSNFELIFIFQANTSSTQIRLCIFLTSKC